MCVFLNSRHLQQTRTLVPFMSTDSVSIYAIFEFTLCCIMQMKVSCHLMCNYVGAANKKPVASDTAVITKRSEHGAEMLQLC